MYYTRPILDHQTPPQFIGTVEPLRRQSHAMSVIGVAMLLLTTGTVYGLTQSPAIAGVIYARSEERRVGKEC